MQGAAGGDRELKPRRHVVTVLTPPLSSKDSETSSVQLVAEPGHVEFERAWKERWARTIDEITSKQRVKRKVAKVAKREADERLGKIIAKWQIPRR
jgi:hypothetical protein